MVMSQLRTYANNADFLDLLDQINRITDRKLLDVLIGVGMRGRLYYAVIARLAKLEGIG